MWVNNISIHKTRLKTGTNRVKCLSSHHHHPRRLNWLCQTTRPGHDQIGIQLNMDIVLKHIEEDPFPRLLLSLLWGLASRCFKLIKIDFLHTQHSPEELFCRRRFDPIISSRGIKPPLKRYVQRWWLADGFVSINKIRYDRARKFDSD